MDVRKYPLVILTNWRNLLIEIRGIVNSNENHIHKTIDDGETIEVRDRTSRFYFRVFDPQFDNRKNVLFQVSYAPGSSVETKPDSAIWVLESVRSNLGIWLTRIKQYDDMVLLPEDEFLKQQETKIFHEFELDILDEDADVTVYDIPRQLFFYRYLEFVEAKLDGLEDPGAKAVLAEIASLKDSLPRISKRRTIKWLSKIIALSHKRGIKFLQEVWDVGRKEIIKAGLKGAYNNLDDLAQTLLS